MTAPLKKAAIMIVTATSAALAGCMSVTAPSADRIASGTFYRANGQPVGTVQVANHGGETMLMVAATGMPAGKRGFHLHTKGECTGPDFTSAGGHLNPLGRAHGHENAGGAHVGDMPNLMFSAESSAAQNVTLPGTRAEIENWIFDGDGTAVIIHAQEDDYRTDPTGNAGARTACAVLSRG